MATKIINNRVNFASVKNPYPYPDFLDVQLKSFSDFLQLDTPPEERKNDGLYKVFAENFPITDTRNNFVLEFLDYFIDPPRYTIAECLERGLTYSVPLKAKMKLYCTDPDHEDFGTFIQDVFLGTSVSSSLSSIVLRVCSSARVSMPMVRCFIAHVSFLSRVLGSSSLRISTT